MIGHLSFGVADLARAARFYDAALAALGFVRVWTNPDGVGYGAPGGGDKLALFARADAAPPGAGFHLAFDAASPGAVDRFHAAAIAAGGTDNGPPGLRPHYSPTYYAAFVIDPDGYRLEAVHQ
jgi:catechol 2,3-dioxygenase-like lactoylglutathione lyase family enzyme